MLKGVKNVQSDRLIGTYVPVDGEALLVRRENFKGNQAAERSGRIKVSQQIVYFTSHYCDDDMHRKTSLVFATLYLAVSSSAFSQADHARILGPQGVNLWKLDKHHSPPKTALNVYDAQDVLQKPSRAGKPPKTYDFPAQWFRQPLDHFDKNSKHSFHQRYWVSTRHYKPRKGAPVIVLDGGETSGEVIMIYPRLSYIMLRDIQERLPFLDTGIVEILARATGGVGVILEHRYYGKRLYIDRRILPHFIW